MRQKSTERIIYLICPESLHNKIQVETPAGFVNFLFDCMKILVVEDEIALAESIVIFLRKEGYLCELATDFASASEKIISFDYDCVLVDISLPDGNGLELIRELKQNHSEAGIIIISAKDALDDKVSGLNLGADDYLTKPFHLTELNARIRSVIRRRNFSGNHAIEFNELKIIPEDKTAYVNEKYLPLTQKEFELLLYLIINKNRVINKSAIAEHLWGSEVELADSYDFIYSHMKNLRKKLLEAGSADYIHTVYGMGYKFGDS